MPFLSLNSHRWSPPFLVVSLGLALLSSCAKSSRPEVGSSAKGTSAEAEQFVADAEKRLLELNIKYGRADWVKSTFITDDTESLSAEANKQVIEATTELAEQSRRFDGVDLPYDTTRKLKLIKLALTLPAPSNAAERDELTKIAASLEGDYGKGKYCPEGDKGKCLSLSEMEVILANSRDPEELKRIWLGWHQVSPPYGKTTSASWSSATRARARWVSKIPARCGVKNTIWSLMPSPLKWSGFGNR